MIRVILFISIILSLLLGSCSSRKSKVDDRNLIPEKDLVSLLIDIHLADGLLANHRVNTMFSALDSIESYYQIIQKHGYTKNMMDKTMKYYFFKKPKELNKIYDKVLGTLSEMEVRVEKETHLELARLSNLWRGKDFYMLPSSSEKDSTWFDMTLVKSGVYTLTFSATLYPDDQTINPKVEAYTVSADSVDTGKRRYLKAIEYLKDGRTHNYSLVFNFPHDYRTKLRGSFINVSCSHIGFGNHIKVENISLSRSLVSS